MSQSLLQWILLRTLALMLCSPYIIFYPSHWIRPSLPVARSLISIAGTLSDTAERLRKGFGGHSRTLRKLPNRGQGVCNFYCRAFQLTITHCVLMRKRKINSFKPSFDNAPFPIRFWWHEKLFLLAFWFPVFKRSFVAQAPVISMLVMFIQMGKGKNMHRIPCLGVWLCVFFICS